MYYVTMTDTYMSGWGLAKNKKSKYILECETLEEAEIVKSNVECREEMKDIMINQQKPIYLNGYHVTISNKENAQNFFKPDYFKYFSIHYDVQRENVVITNKYNRDIYYLPADCFINSKTSQKDLINWAKLKKPICFT